MKQLLFTGLAALVFVGGCSAANKYVQHNLVSDIATSPLWVSANEPVRRSRSRDAQRLAGGVVV